MITDLRGFVFLKKSQIFGRVLALNSGFDRIEGVGEGDTKNIKKRSGKELDILNQIIAPVIKLV